MGAIKTYSIPVKSFSIQGEDNNSEQFLRAKFFAISEGNNLNQSAFKIEGMRECLESNDYANKPILGAWKKDKVNEFGNGDFGGHESEVGYDGEVYNTYLGEKNERPLGLILPQTARIEEYKGVQWLSFEGCIWSKYNREAVSLLKKKRKNNVSVEIEVLESYEDERGIEVITKFTLLGITVIGVECGIENACLDVMEFSKTQQFNSFVMAFSKAKNGKENEVDKGMEFIKKDQYGTGEVLKIDLTKDSASNDKWGSISKTNLRNDLLKAKNYKSIIPKAYLVVEEGWEESPSEKLKYPIVQIKDGKVVLNINGVHSATAYLMKEKDSPYFKKAKAKLNKIRKELGMERLYGLEWNDDWGEIVVERQPNILKMGDNAKVDKKEMKAKLCSLFADKEEKAKKLVELKKSYEDKVGEFEFAEDDKKEVCEKEMDEAKKFVDEAECDMAKCEKDILDMAKCMADEDDDDDDDEEEIDDEEEEYPIDTVGKDKYEKAIAEKGMSYVSNSKSYIIGEKDGEIYACKYECGEYKEIKMANEEAIKCEKVYAIFKTGGCLSKDDVDKFPTLQVGISKGFAKVYADKIEKEEKIEKIEKDNVDYKKMAEENICKLEEMACEDEMPKDYKKEVMSKIFANEFKSANDMEIQVKAKLYEVNKGKILGGSFPKNANTANKAECSEYEQINAVLKKYKK